MPAIELNHVTKNWGKFYAVDDLSLKIEDHAFVTLLGPSGCGKTTTLRMIAGLETPSSGRISIGDRVVFDAEAGINVPPNKRKVGFLFQNYALWPNMTVYDNIAFGLKNIKEELPRVHAGARQAADLLQALAQPEEVANLLQGCRSEGGKLDKKKALLLLLERYEMSLFTAEKLLGYRLDQAADPAAAAASIREQLQADIAEAEKSARAEGLGFNDDFAYMRDGVVQTEVRRLSKEEVDHRVREVSRVVKIGMFMDRYPAELSGGQQQRVAIARTLAPSPQVLFMDEPLSNLDAKLRLEMRSELQRLHLQTGATFIYVTHDQLEAMTLATKICLLDNGSLQQYAAPLEIYKRPVNTFVADFVGNPSINFLPARAVAGAGPAECGVLSSAASFESAASAGSAECGGALSDSAEAPTSASAFQLTVMDKYTMCFRPTEAYDQAALLQQFKADQAASQERQVQLKKDNPDRLFEVPVARVQAPLLEGVKETFDEEDFWIGIRPENIHIDEAGPLEAEVYSVMPTGMETTVKLRVGDYLLTAVIFGSILYQIGEKVRLSFQGKQALLFSSLYGRTLTLGQLEALD